ncbi:MAG: glycosyltransferase family 4 protein [Lentisphaerales bacterium]|nr:glycosyltransferase family 4 protein [Lentisphaerales bacterium]
MNILVLSFFYPPDLSAGSFRIKSVIDELKKKTSSSDKIQLITNYPNRYMSFTDKVLESEVDGNVSIKRCELPSNGKGFISQVRRFLSYRKFVLKEVKDKKYDLVFATSSRLFTAALGVEVAKKYNCPSYIDIRDLFVDTFQSTFPAFLSMPLLPLFKHVEKTTFNGATKVNVVSAGFISYIRSNYKISENIDEFTNGVDEIFMTTDKSVEFASSLTDFLNKEKRKRPVILYAGNLGKSQAMDEIIPAMAKGLPEYDIVIVGDGNTKKSLLETVSLNKLDNIHIFPPVKREFVPFLYEKADVLFLHLSQAEAFEKVLPSKLFEYAASGKPIVAGVSGFAKTFCKSEINNCVVFEPNTSEAAIKSVKSVSLKVTDRLAFVEKYKRTLIIEKLVESFLSLERV